MKSKISALIDGELASHEREGAIAALRTDPGLWRGGPKPQTFSTCEKSSSTGVERPKIVTLTRTFDFS